MNTTNKNDMDAGDWMLIGFLGCVIAFILFIGHYPSKNEPKLRADCEARGGLLIVARGTKTHFTCVAIPPPTQEKGE